MYRTIACETWDDPWFADLTPPGKLLFLYLITNRRTTACGAFEITHRAMAFETGLTADQLDTALSELQAGGRVAWWADLQVVWVRNFYKHQRANSNDKFTLSARRSLVGFPDAVQAAIGTVYPELWDTNGTPIPPPSHTNKETVTETDQQQEQEQEDRAPADAPPPRALVPVPKIPAGFDFPGLWAAVETMLGYKPTWNYAKETQAVKRLVMAHPRAAPADFVAFLAYAATVYPYSKNPDEQATFSVAAPHFGKWFTGGQPTAAQEVPANGKQPHAVSRSTERASALRTTAAWLAGAPADDRGMDYPEPHPVQPRGPGPRRTVVDSSRVG